MTSKVNKTKVKMDLSRKLKFIMAFSAIVVMLTVSVAHGAFFDTAGKSARAMGMGEVFLGSSSDASGYWYNPAGLSKFKTRQLGIGYGKPVAFVSDLMTSQINFVTPLGETSGLGIGLAYQGVDGASDMVISGAYGLSLGESMSIGANLKLLRWAAEGQEIAWGTGSGTDDDLSKISVSLDLSALYSFGSLMTLDDFTAGVYVKDAIMPNISEAGGDDGKLPIEIGVGMMAQKEGITVGGDVAYLDGETIFRAGIESGVAGSDLKIRGGYIFGSDFEDELEQSDLDLGIGYVFGSLVFDYAYNLPMAFKETGGKHYVSFGISF